jgi:hypothetical protein
LYSCLQAQAAQRCLYTGTHAVCSTSLLACVRLLQGYICQQASIPGAKPCISR